MPSPAALLSAVPTSDRRVPTWLRLVAVPVVVAVVVAGVWLAGAVLTEDATGAMALTTLWFGLLGVIALLVGLRWRRLALPVLGTYAVTAAVVGGALLWTSTVDRVVDEEVVVVADDAPATGTTTVGPTALARGDFASLAHETVGTATLLVQPDGSRLLTLTGFETDPGPDLRVYVSPDMGGAVDGAIDIGALKGNLGDQQYELPVDSPSGSVVIWCRAFSVGFGVADLA